MIVRLMMFICAMGFSADAVSQNHDLTEHPVVKSNIELLDVWLQAEVEYRQQPGVVVGIVYKDDLIYAKAFGLSDIESKKRMTTDTIFRIGSQSKQFVAIALMQLQEAGKLSLSDAASKYLPDFSANEEIAISHLLTHTAGLKSETNGTLYWTEFDFPNRDAIIKQTNSRSAVYPTSHTRKYSNLGYALAGQIVENVSGKDFGEYVDEHILKPLGMNSTTARMTDVDQGRLATGYGRRMPSGNRERIPAWDAKGMTPAFGMYSTVKDLAQFVTWQIQLRASEEKLLLRPETWREISRARWVDPDWMGGWGIGFQIVRKSNQTLVGHMGQVPGYFSTTYVDPEQELGVVVLTNSMDSQPYLGQPRSIQERVFALIGPALKTASGDVAKDGEKRWTKLSGMYRSIWGDFYVMNLEGDLVLLDPTQADPKAFLFTLEPIKDRPMAFRFSEGPDPQLVDETVVFDFDDDNDVATGFRLLGGAKFSRIR